MPIFRKRNKLHERAEPQKEFLEKEVRETYNNGKKIKEYAERQHWIVERSPLDTITFTIPWLDSFIKKTFKKKGKPVVVLDWGCGNGNAINELAEKCGEMVHAYGYSKDSYKEWVNSDKVKFIHATKEKLPRYLKNNSVDLIYSHIGIGHTFISYWGEIDQQVAYIKKIVPKLSKGGRLVFDLPVFKDYRYVIPVLRDALKKEAKVVSQRMGNRHGVVILKK